MKTTEEPEVDQGMLRGIWSVNENWLLLESEEERSGRRTAVNCPEGSCQVTPVLALPVAKTWLARARRSKMLMYSFMTGYGVE